MSNISFNQFKLNNKNSIKKSLYIKERLFSLYLMIINLFKNLSLPPLKFRNKSDDYAEIYQSLYNLDINTLYKANFGIFLLSFLLSLLIGSFLSINLPFLLLFSLFLSIFVSYNFSSIIFNKIKKLDLSLNSFLPLLQMRFNLIQYSLEKNDDQCIPFIKLIMKSSLPVATSYKNIFKNIHLGKEPYGEIEKLKTPSLDFDSYVMELIMNDFNELKVDYETTLNQKLEIYLNALDSKISVIFFIGFFLPISLCFLIMFINLPIYFSFGFSISFLIFMYYIFNKLIVSDILFIGFFKNSPYFNKRQFEEFLIFLKAYAFRLKYDLSPEKAFFDTLLKNKNRIRTFYLLIKKICVDSINKGYSFSKMISLLQNKLNSPQYNLILSLIHSMVLFNSKRAGFIILELIEVIKEQQKILNKIENVFKGERFRVFIFLFLLPIITGIFSGFLPFFSLFLMISPNSVNKTFQLMEIILILVSISFCNIVTSYTFLRIINYEKHYFFLLLSLIILIFSFLSSYSFLLSYSLYY